MKIKYSNIVRNQISDNFIKELVELSYTTVPTFSLHVFSFFEEKNGETRIVHIVPEINFKEIIHLPRHNIPNEEIILLRNSNTIYILSKNELLNI